MSPPVAAGRGEIFRRTPGAAAKTDRPRPRPPSPALGFSLVPIGPPRHALGLHSTIRVAARSDCEPSQFLRYAAPPIRSGILLLTLRCQPPDRPSSELTRHTLGRPW